MPLTKQLSLFGVESLPPTPFDLEGLLAGPGQVTRMGGTARISIVVDAAWRVAVLRDEFALRGLSTSWDAATIDGHVGVRTAYSAALAPLSERWLHGASKAPPDDFGLDGRRLRLLVAAVGIAEGPRAFSFRLGSGDGETVWLAMGAALAVLGLAGALLGQRASGPTYRMTGRRRIARLGELIGDPPSQAPPGSWPR